MRSNIRNIHQQKAYLQVQRVLYLFFLSSYVKVLKEAVETVASSGLRVTGSNEPETLFMQLSALQGSILENRVFEDDFEVESISTAKLFQLVNSQPATEILTIDSANIDTILPTLPFADNIKEDIRNTVNQNLTIRIPQSDIIYEDWTGIGYIKEDPETGESGWMLSGMAGGMTAWGLDKWSEYYLERLINPYSEPPNYDPTSAAYIQKITYTDMQKGTVGTELAEPLQVLVHDNTMKPVKGAEVRFTVKAGGGRFSNGQTSITVKTNYEGIASAEFILGKYTKDNPTFWWEAGYTYSQQIGENIVNAELSSGTSITVPFTAYGFPKEPDHINKTFGDGQRGAILSFAGFVSLMIEDEFDNPISNIPVDFSVVPAIEQSTCENSNQDGRSAVLVKTDDPCIENAPTLGECSTESASIQEVTSSKGAAVEVILGGIPEAEYPIEVRAGQLKETFNLHTDSFGNCEGGSAPSNQLYGQYVYPADPYGNNINAAKTGTAIPVMARMYYLREGEKEAEVTLSCDDGPVTCTKIVGSRQYSIDTDFTESTLSFSGIEGTPQGGGIYTTMYTLSAGLNTIIIDGTATVTQGRSVLSCSGCSTANENITQGVSATMEVYGVDIQTEPVPVILVDENGYAKQDYTINYTITPSGYKAMTAYVMIYKAGEADPIVAIPSETSGQGMATIAGGFWFDVNSTYEAEVVLNYGTGVEIRGERVEIAVAEIRVLNDKVFEPNNVKEIKFGDGSRIEKRYHIELESKALTETCDGLRGKVRVVNKKWMQIKEPDTNTYYPAKYDLKFRLVNNKCKVDIINTSNETKEKFIITNLSKEALGLRTLQYSPPADLTSIMPLYGGIGNQLEVEINGAKEHVAIEPVGVVVIGIDGLRQDVLYGPEEASYSDPQGCGGQSCYIDKVNLPGLSQILTDNGTVRLKDVTAIFPSITYASWASIFTGKMPNETGIMGNEYFARDIYRSNIKLQGLENFPLGIVVYSDGAFKIERPIKYYTKHILPADWNGEEWKDLSVPGQTLQAATVYEEVAPVLTGYHTSPDNRIKCDGSEYECRSAVVFNHYARGSDRWRTISNPLQSAWDALTGGTAYLMDSTPAYEAEHFINSYFNYNNPDGERKRFPAVFTVYFAGLDHEAHDRGMSEYKQFLTQTTDPEISKVVNALKQAGEFDNKIFIIVADHGHTAMPTTMKYKHKEELIPDSGVYVEYEMSAEMSCKLKTDFQIDPENPEAGMNNQLAETSNNNLHIWELGNLFTQFPSPYQDLILEVLAPEEIANVIAGATADINEANVIAAMNGPMAHVYIKGIDWNSDPDQTIMGMVLDRLNKVLTLIFT